jgi:hypothetical protein
MNSVADGCCSVCVGYLSTRYRFTGPARNADPHPHMDRPLSRARDMGPVKKYLGRKTNRLVVINLNRVRT